MSGPAVLGNRDDRSPWCRGGWSCRDKSKLNTIMFRASPWITYDPPTSESHPPHPTDNDAEMDAPQISTLHDDGESPPSNASPARTGKFRVKLPANEAKMGTKFITFNGKTGEEAAAAEDHEEDEPDEDEEDELIDDEEDASTPAASGSGGAAGAPSSSSAPAKTGTKRPSTRIKSSQARRKARLNGPSAAPSSTAPTTASSEAQSKDVRDAAPSTEPSSTAPQASLAVPAPTSKKKAVPKGTTAAQRAPRKSAPKYANALSPAFEKCLNFFFACCRQKTTTTTTATVVPPPTTDAATAATEASESNQVPPSLIHLVANIPRITSERQVTPAPSLPRPPPPRPMLAPQNPRPKPKPSQNQRPKPPHRQTEPHPPPSLQPPRPNR